MNQQVSSDVNQHYSWIAAGNQKDYDKKQIDSSKVSMDNVFYVLFAKKNLTKIPPRKTRIKMTTLRSFALCLARGVKR